MTNFDSLVTSIELGHVFCYEAKQKRIIIGDEYFFVDLVFASNGPG